MKRRTANLRCGSCLADSDFLVRARAPTTERIKHSPLPSANFAAVRVRAVAGLLKAAGQPTIFSGVIRAIRSISAIRVSGVHDAARIRR